MKGFHHTKPRQTPPFVTADKAGRFVINKGAMNLLRLHRATHVHLLFDGTARRVAVRPVPVQDQCSFELKYERSQAHWNIPRLWRYVGVHPRHGGQRFLAFWNDAAGHLEVVVEAA